jgi:hypothetical protein
MICVQFPRLLRLLSLLLAVEGLSLDSLDFNDGTQAL